MQITNSQIKKNRAYAKIKAKEEFDVLIKAWEELGDKKPTKELRHFKKRGKFQKELYYTRFKKPKKKKIEYKKETLWDKLSKSSSFRPYQGGTPSLGKKK